MKGNIIFSIRSKVVLAWLSLHPDLLIKPFSANCFKLLTPTSSALILFSLSQWIDPSSYKGFEFTPFCPGVLQGYIRVGAKE